MTIKESFQCPHCGAEKTAIVGAQAIMDDVRFDSLRCTECGAEWRAYFKVSELSSELMYVPAKDENPNPVCESTQSECTSSTEKTCEVEVLPADAE